MWWKKYIEELVGEESEKYSEKPKQKLTERENVSGPVLSENELLAKIDECKDCYDDDFDVWMIKEEECADVLSKIAINQGCTEKVFKAILTKTEGMYDSCENVLFNILDNENATEEVLLAVCEQKKGIDYYKWRKFDNCVAKHPNYSFEVAKKLEPEDISLITNIIFQKDCSKSVFDDAVDYIFEWGKLDKQDDNGFTLGDRIAASRYCDDSLFNRLVAEDCFSHNVLEVLVSNEMCPDCIIEKVLENSINDVSYGRVIEHEICTENIKSIVANPGLSDKIKQSIIDEIVFVDKEQDKLDILYKIAENSIDNAELMLTIYDCGDDVFKALMSDKYSDILQKGIIERKIKQEEKDKEFLSIMKEAHQAVMSSDEGQIDAFRKKLFSGNESDIFAIDHRCVEAFINDGKPETFEMLNSLRSFYGLTTKIEDFSQTNSDVNDARRIRFSGMISAIGADNPHYKRKHSEAFLKFRPNYKKDYSLDDYNLSESQAFQTMKAEGAWLPEQKIKEALAAMHVSPRLVKKFNVTDLCHIIVENSGVDIDEERGAMLDINDLVSKRSGSVREKYWKKVAKNEQLVEFISKDLSKKGVSQEDIEQIWDNCKESGSPCHDEYGNRNVYNVSLQLHHERALKDGGENVYDNFVVVISMLGEYDVCYDGDVYTRGEGTEAINTHKPLHEYDNPLVELYQDLNGNIIKEQSEGGKRVKILTFPLSSNIKSGEHVLYYGGATEESCCVGNINGDIHQAEYNVVKNKSVVSNIRRIHNGHCK